MAMGAQLTLVVNPGSSSRKYGIFSDDAQIASVHIEHAEDGLRATLATGGVTHHPNVQFSDITHSTQHLLSLLKQYKVIQDTSDISQCVLRVVAPTGYFLRDRILTNEAVERLKQLSHKAPLHITATLQELHVLQKLLPGVPIVGISDSAFHAQKPDRAWNYGLPIHDSDVHEIKRFGYHGISASAVVNALHSVQKLPRRLIVCHLGSGASVTAINNGKSIDNTMGYTPLEGLIMATRSGSLDAGAYAALKHDLRLDDAHMQQYLNHSSGLLGLSGVSENVKTILEAEEQGNRAAALALETYVYDVQKAIGQMMAALQGVDALVFTGTVGERAAIIRERITECLHFADFYLDTKTNGSIVLPKELVCISKLAQSKPIFVVPAQESAEMNRLSRLVV